MLWYLGERGYEAPIEAPVRLSFDAQALGVELAEAVRRSVREDGR